MCSVNFYESMQILKYMNIVKKILLTQLSFKIKLIINIRNNNNI